MLELRGENVTVCVETLESRTLLAANASVSGVVFNDLDGDGVRDQGEPGVANWRVYLDPNNNGLWDAGGEPFVLTDASGRYQASPPAGFHRGRVVVPSGWSQTAPNGSHSGTLAMGQVVNGANFGVRQIQVGPNRIQNSGPTQGIPYVREGFEPLADSGPFGNDLNNHFSHYFLRGIDHWKYERLTESGTSFHSVTFDYNTRSADMGYLLGDRYSGFIQTNNSWGNTPLPVRIHSTTRTILRFDVRSNHVPGSSSYFYSTPDFASDPMNFARQTFVTDTMFKTTSNGPVTIDFDFWEKASHTTNVSDPQWWFRGGTLGNDATAAFPNEFFPRWQTNGSGVYVMPVEGLRENPEGMIHDRWTSVAIDLSWAYEWVLRLHPDRIQNARSYSADAPPSVWRVMSFIEGCNLKANMDVKDIRWQEWNLSDPATRDAYVRLFNDTTVKSYPFNAHVDYIQTSAGNRAATQAKQQTPLQPIGTSKLEENDRRKRPAEDLLSGS